MERRIRLHVWGPGVGGRWARQGVRLRNEGGGRISLELYSGLRERYELAGRLQTLMGGPAVGERLISMFDGAPQVAIWAEAGWKGS